MIKSAMFFRAALMVLALFMASTAQVQAAEVSRALAKPLKAAQEALTAKNYNEAIAKAREANGTTGKTDYDQYIINQFLRTAYVAQNNIEQATVATEAELASPHSPPANRLVLLRALMYMYSQGKNWEKALGTGQRAQAAGDSSDDTALAIAGFYQKLGRSNELANSLQEIVRKAEAGGRRPGEASLTNLWNAQKTQGKPAAASETMEKLIRYYPKPIYWSNAVAGIRETVGNDDKLKLHLYRLLSTVGVLSKGDEFREMAQIAIDQGNPGEAQSAMEQAFAKNLFTDEQSKVSNARLLEMARSKATADKAGMVGHEQRAKAAATGDSLVALGGAYVGYGMADKGLVAINAGFAKGGLKNSYDSTLLLGYASIKAGNKAEAVRAFSKVASDAKAEQKYKSLANLWLLHAR